MPPKFSIVIPVYNVAPYLRECLDSLLNQTYADWEAVCVDDGSTDESRSILKLYAAKDSRIKIINQKNAGVSVARNHALECIEGEYVGFLDGDDVIVSNWLEVVAGTLAENPLVDWVRLGFKKWDGGKLVGSKQVNGKTVYYADARSYLWNEVCRSGYGWRNFIRRSVIGPSRFTPDLRISEDTLFLLKQITKVNSCCYIDFDGYAYRIRSGSALRNHSRSCDSIVFADGFLEVFRLACTVIPNFKELCRTCTESRLDMCVDRWRGFVFDMTRSECIHMRDVLLEFRRQGCEFYRNGGGKGVAWRFVIRSGSKFILEFARLGFVKRLFHLLFV